MKKFVIAIIFCIGLILTMVYAVIGGMTSLTFTNSNTSYAGNGLSKAQRAFGEEVNLPEFLKGEPDITYIAVNGTERYFSAKSNRFEYQITEFVTNPNVRLCDIDLSQKTLQDETYPFDKWYKPQTEDQETDTGNDEITDKVDFIHYRTNGNSTVVDIFTGLKVCELIMLNYNGYDGFGALLEGLNIETNSLVDITSSMNSNTNKTSIDESTSTTKTVKFEYNELGISFELPSSEDINIIGVVETDKHEVSYLLDNKLIMIIEKTNEIGEKSPKLKYTEIENGYTLELMADNPFESGTVEFNYFETLNNSLDSVIKSVKLIN